MAGKPYFVCILFGLLMPTALNAQSAQAPAAGNLSLADALALAAATNPLIRRSSANVTAATDKLRSARTQPNPLLGLAHWAGRDTGGLDEDIILTQIVELGGKVAYRTRTAGAELTAARFDQFGTALDLRLSVQAAYYEALRTQEDYKVAQDTLGTTRKFVEAAQIQYQAGDVARSNVLRSDVELARVQQSLTAAQTERENRLATLRSLIGLPTMTSVNLSDKLVFAPVSYSIPDLQTLAVQNRPDIKSAEATRAALAATVQSVRAETRPDLFIEGRRASLNPAVEGTSIRAGVTFTLIDLGRNRADVAAAQAAVAEQDAKIAEAVRIAKLEVETDYRNLEQARSVVETFEKGRLAQSKELLDMTETGYDRGASTYLEVLDAQNVYRSEQADYYRALADYDIALATLERAVGGKLP